MRTRFLAPVLILLAPAITADEGMWTYNNFPSDKVKAAYGFEPTSPWLENVRLSSLRIASGCSSSVVSPEGLVLTNHHCARRCIENLSGLLKKDFSHSGFTAKTTAQEVRCPNFELNQLVEITDVTSKVAAATAGVDVAKYSAAVTKASAAIEKECANDKSVRCEVVSLYRGGAYDLYKYNRFDDIRLVLAPEESIAFFGGDPDNFTFPRWDLDFTLLRIYGPDGKPAKTPHYLPWAMKAATPGDLTFVAGNPGSTSRGVTTAQLDDDRDGRLPDALLRWAELRGILTEYQMRGAEQKRHSGDMLFGVENSFKGYTGRREALLDTGFVNKLRSNESDFRAKVKANPELEKAYGGVWADVDKLVEKQAALRSEYDALEKGFSNSRLFTIARHVLRWSDERNKPTGDRLKEYSDARLPQLKAELLSNAPVYDELEITNLTFSLDKLRRALGPDDARVKRIFGKKSSREIAVAAVKGTRLKDLKTDKYGNAIGGFRDEVFNSGINAARPSQDSMIAFARSFDPDARAIREQMEKEVQGPLAKDYAKLSKARIALYGKSYPDATFSPRLSYGSVKGYTDSKGKEVAPFTFIGGAFERATGNPPFDLPKSWIAAETRLNKSVPFNFVTTNDIIGGNSGSPVINKNGELVGLVFDGNIDAFGGEYLYDGTRNRTVAVANAAIIESLEKIYGGQRIVNELRAGASARATAP